MSNFWESGGFVVSATVGSMDAHLSGNTTMQDYVRGRTASVGAVPSGTRVVFDGKLASLLAYSEPPERGDLGTVVMCRTAMGDTTEHDGLVFVKFDGGRFMGVHRAHLVSAPSASRTAHAYRMTVTAVGDLTDFMKSAGEDLIHKSTKDLWKLSKTDGEYVIERLFDETGNPLKV